MTDSAPTVHRHRTAIRRNQLSRPVATALRDQVLAPGDTFFDFGCGHGEDVELLRGMGYGSAGWDPHFRPDQRQVPSAVVNLGYVLNVIESPDERAAVLKKALALAKGALVVSALIGPGGSERTVPHGDGLLTSRGTFQKYFRQEELGRFLTDQAGKEAYPAGLGIYYLFNDPQREADYCRRLLEDPDRQGPSLPGRGWMPLHPETLKRIADQVMVLGRLPLPEEFPEEVTAVSMLARSEDWLDRLAGHLDPARALEIRRERRARLLDDLAASYYSPSGRLRLQDLDLAQRADLRSLFGSIARAYAEAEAYLEGVLAPEQLARVCRQWGEGKLVHDSLYFHPTRGESAPPAVRLMLRCARLLFGPELTGQENLVKITFTTGRVTFATYEDLESVAHPALQGALRACLEEGVVLRRDYRGAANPPILHRKELFVGREHPSWELFARLTAQEARAGLLGRADIGNRLGWERALREAGFQVQGHELLNLSGEALVEETSPAELEGVLEGVEAAPAPDEAFTARGAHFVRRRRRADRRAPKPRRLRERLEDEGLKQVAERALELGRLPLPSECAVSPRGLELLRKDRAWTRVLEPWMDPEAFQEARRRRWSHWIVFLGSARLGTLGRPPFRKLSAAAQEDLRVLFGSYQRALAESDTWLFRIGRPDEIDQDLAAWPFGIRQEEKGAVFHASLEERLPILPRMLVACGRQLAGDRVPPGTNVIRVGFGGDHVKFYEYENLESPEPSRLLRMARVDFRKRRAYDIDYRERGNFKVLEEKGGLLGGAPDTPSGAPELEVRGPA